MTPSSDESPETAGAVPPAKKHGPASPNGDAVPGANGSITSLHPYRDEEGGFLFQGVTYDTGAVAYRRPDGRGGWAWGLRGRRIPYLLPELVKHPDPILITKSEKDADAAAKLTFTATASPGGLGRWLANWSGYFSGRRCVIVLGSDDPEIGAAAKVAFALRRGGSKVKILVLPGEGVRGVLDWIGAGGTADELLRLIDAAADATKGLLPSMFTKSEVYEATESGFIYWKETSGGFKPVRLTNFVGRITGNIVLDDGVQETRAFEVATNVHGHDLPVIIPSAKYNPMSWVAERLGPMAVVFPGMKDHARAAIQVLSGNIPSRRIFSHTGWQKVGDDWIFLHAGGGLGADGVLPAVEVELDGRLERVILPEPPSEEELRRAVRASLSFLEVGPDEVTVPLFAAIYRAPVGESDFTLSLVGPTGAGKTSTLAVAQQHYGTGLDAAHLPASWSGTAASLEDVAFRAKDLLLGVDDFCPAGAAEGAGRAHREADRFLRSQANRIGRRRMRPHDLSITPSREPRGLVVLTGEETPAGRSLQARLIIVAVEHGMIRWDLLTRAQKDGADGLYARAMSGYIAWLAPRYEQVRSGLERRVAELRPEFTVGGGHPKTPSNVAGLMVGLEEFLRFAGDIGAVTDAEEAALRERFRVALVKVAAIQAKRTAEADPAARFLGDLAEAMESGRAYVAALNGAHPQDPGSWGWNQENGVPGGWRPRGNRLGWLDGDNFYLDIGAAFMAAKGEADRRGETLKLTSEALKRRLRDGGFLASVEERGGKTRLEIRRPIEGVRRYVLHLRAADVRPEGGPGGPGAMKGPMK